MLRTKCSVSQNGFLRQTIALDIGAQKNRLGRSTTFTNSGASSFQSRKGEIRALAEPESSDLLQQRRHLLPLRRPACTRFRGYVLQGSNASVIVFRMIKLTHW